MVDAASETGVLVAVMVASEPCGKQPGQQPGQQPGPGTECEMRGAAEYGNDCRCVFILGGSDKAKFEGWMSVCSLMSRWRAAGVVYDVWCVWQTATGHGVEMYEQTATTYSSG